MKGYSSSIDVIGISLNILSYMYKSIIKTLFVVVLGLTITPLAYTQNNTSSPYSMYGIGQTGYGINARSVAMGDVSVGIRTNERINPKMAASYTALDSVRIFYDLGATGIFTYATEQGESETTFDGNITSLNVATRIMKHWYGGFGVFPRSSIGYNITTYNTVEGTLEEYPTYWSGSGGLSQFYFNNAFSITDNFSVGVNFSVYVGPMTSTKQQVFNANSSVEITTDELSEHYSGITGDISAQYTLPINDNSKLILGAKFAPSSSLSGDSHQQIVHNSSASGINDTIKNESSSAAVIDLPSSYSVGASYMLSDNLVVALDYQRVNWGDIQSNNSDYNYTNQNIFNVGFEYVNNRESLKYKDHIAYRLGFKYDDGYLNVRHNQLKDWSVSMGLGFPIRRSLSYIDVAFVYGQRGSNQYGMILENYAQCMITFSLSDRWFRKRVID
ncbi:outer membrane protein transport protein [Halosquirtibacter xylanolyticus]|uniref:OmpP1/FadL family transporter n=1 Tax=Halosquirtibacter xylanolyticus TaxID=3374599 RepID=UPI00374860E2|nr:outer membrane protein transport protein [Prolixibacteraceae bacterium]